MLRRITSSILLVVMITTQASAGLNQGESTDQAKAQIIKAVEQGVLSEPDFKKKRQNLIIFISKLQEGTRNLDGQALEAANSFLSQLVELKARLQSADDTRITDEELNQVGQMVIDHFQTAFLGIILGIITAFCGPLLVWIGFRDESDEERKKANFQRCYEEQSARLDGTWYEKSLEQKNFGCVKGLKNF